MKISYNWLKDYIHIDLDVETVSKILTDIGLEVEGYELFQTIRGGLQGVVVGKVLTCEKHPNADKLHVTTVDIGNTTIVPIVCGAPNVAAGQTVLVATEGTKLYSGDSEFVIKATKIRGEVSQGMICAEDELGLGTSHDGIIVLSNEIAAGTLASDYYNIQDDYVFEIGLTPNRIDAASHIGVARDIAAFLSLSGVCNITKPSVATFAPSNSPLSVTVEVANFEACPRYTGLVIRGVHIGESPQWLQNRLRAIGQKPINNVVDVTNYVLHEMAQPLHAFDVSKIEGNKVVVTTLTEKTKFVTLDGVERELHANDLMICDASKPMCIAGVFGGIESGVTNDTCDIFLESAYFNPVFVRKTARRHGLSTDASFRFERGVDPNNTVYALKRAAILIQEIAGGTIESGIFDSHPNEFPSFTVQLQYSKICALIGKHIEKQTIRTILEALEITIAAEDGDSLTVMVPPYRGDVQRQEDIVEDILRIYGYNNVEIPSAIRSSVVFSHGVDSTKLKHNVSNMLVAEGFYEIMNNSLTRSSYYQKFEPELYETRVSILNPLSAELDCMRSSLLFGCLEVVAYNKNRQTSDVSIFEFGSVYHHVATEGTVIQKYKEQQHLAICSIGKQMSQHWNYPNADTDIFVLKSHVSKILQKLGLQSYRYTPMQNSTLDGLECVVNKRIVGRLGVVKPAVCKQFDIEKPCFYAEMYWDVLLELFGSPIQYKEIPQYPEVRRDLALLLDNSIEFETIKKLAFETERTLLKHVTAFDVYQGKGVPDGKKSYAIAFTLLDKEKTLTDAQIDAVMSKLIAKYTSVLGAELR